MAFLVLAVALFRRAARYDLKGLVTDAAWQAAKARGRPATPTELEQRVVSTLAMFPAITSRRSRCAVRPDALASRPLNIEVPNFTSFCSCIFYAHFPLMTVVSPVILRLNISMSEFIMISFCARLTISTSMSTSLSAERL